MKIKTGQVIRIALFIILVVSCFQAILYLFPPDRFNVFSPYRLLAGFVMCSVVLIHNLLFNRYFKTLKKKPAYFSISIIILLISWGLLFFLTRFRSEADDAATSLLISLIVTVYFLLTGLVLNEIYFVLTRQSNYLENQVMMKQLELDHLKNQLNPHFLFNSLNNVAATMQVDTELALNYIYTLSSLLRYQVESSDKEFVTLSEENFFIESFLGIEEVRLGDRCEITFDSEISNSAEKIPPMLLQPFVERAIRQSNCLSNKAVIKISLQEKDKELFLLIHGTIPVNAPKVPANGIGIENAIRRLEMFYPSSHRILNNELNGFIETSLFINLNSFKRIS
ncbi:MAG: histidine kinase [Bacteroidota bacterium]